MRIGSLCTGIGGLELALDMVGEHELVFVADNDDDCSALLEHRYPGIPNLGGWPDCEILPAVDLLVGGLPCQPVSQAGRRAGTTDERWLFDDLADQIGRMGTRPDVFLENVPGVLTANGGHAMARVVSRLGSLGYVGRWGCLPASAVGACHRRLRWWCYATADPDGLRLERLTPIDRPHQRVAIERGHDPARRDGAAPADAGGERRGQGARPRTGEPARLGRDGPHHRGGEAAAHPDLEGPQGPQPTRRRQLPAGSDRTSQPGELTLLPTPQANLGDGRGLPSPSHAQQRMDDGRRNLDDAVALLPTPTANQPGGTAEQHLERKARIGDGFDRTEITDLRMKLEALDLDVGRWGDYAGAIARWEVLFGRPVPSPLQDGKRLDPVFVEWMMGFPPGWVTDLEFRRTTQLRMLGNAVVPAQGALALRLLLEDWPT